MASVIDYDVEKWYWDEVRKVDQHAQQLETLLFNRLQQMKRGENPEVGYGIPKRGDIRKTELCLSHATQLADHTERIATKNPYTSVNKMSNISYAGIVLGVIGFLLMLVGLFVMALSSFWVGFGLSVGGLVLLLVGTLIFVGSKRVVFATIGGVSLGVLLLAFIILLVVLL
jgi:hypothetical protein